MIVERIKGSHTGFRSLQTPAGTHKLNHQNWVKADHVQTSFDIQHDGVSIYLQYYVQEQHVRAVNSDFNSSVWEDSCVEFFFSLKGDEKNFYNFEFNAIGAVLGGHGKDRNERNRLPDSLLEKIEVLPSLGREPFGEIHKETSWNLQVRIPLSTLCFNEIADLSGKDGYANFYKCGDKLKQPHFLSWKPVLTSTPDFHQPRYFGQLSFL